MFNLSKDYSHKNIPNTIKKIKYEMSMFLFARDSLRLGVIMANVHSWTLPIYCLKGHRSFFLNYKEFEERNLLHPKLFNTNNYIGIDVWNKTVYKNAVDHK